MPDRDRIKGGKVRLRIGLPLVLLAFAALLYLATVRLESFSDSPYPVTRTVRFDPDLVSSQFWAGRPGNELAGQDLPIQFAFRRGETLGGVLDDLGLEPDEAQAIVAELAEHIDVRRLRPVDHYSALIDESSGIQGFRLTLDGKGWLEATRDGGSWRSHWRPFEEQARLAVVKGSLQGSLEASIQRAGGKAVLAYAMADVLQWDIDFNRDLRVDDRFEIFFEATYLEGEFHRIARILALRYENGGKLLEAYQFGEDGSHYDADGRPLRKLFLRSPLRYSRITSGFSGRRFHPVLKRYRPHYGVDYGAPTGTPIRVTANGVVQSAGWDKGGGKMVKVRHPNGYVTAYLHLSRFASGIKSGRRVTQGEVIGYVGSTGLATGPHLDYRVQHNGKWINPQGLKNEPAEPIPREQLADFIRWRDLLREQVDRDRPRLPEPIWSGQQVADLNAAEESASGQSLGR